MSKLPEISLSFIQCLQKHRQGVDWDGHVYPSFSTVSIYSPAEFVETMSGRSVYTFQVIISYEIDSIFKAGNTTECLMRQKHY